MSRELSELAGQPLPWELMDQKVEKAVGLNDCADDYVKDEASGMNRRGLLCFTKTSRLEQVVWFVDVRSIDGDVVQAYFQRAPISEILNPKGLGEQLIKTICRKWRIHEDAVRMRILNNAPPR